MTDKELFESLAGTSTTRTIRKCAYTNKLEVVGSDGMTDKERKNHEQIVKQWTSQAKK